MPPIQSVYEHIRDQIQPGDVIAFSGKKPLSRLIQTFTRSKVSHVGVVCKPPTRPDSRPGVCLVEANELGVRLSRLNDKVRHHEGEIWWLPLSNEARSTLNEEEFHNFIENNRDAGYDYSLLTLVMAALDWGDSLGTTLNREDLDEFFCSELVTAALEAGCVLSSINASEVTPIDICRFDIYADDYHQLRGEAERIRGFSSVPPIRWGL